MRSFLLCSLVLALVLVNITNCEDENVEKRVETSPADETTRLPEVTTETTSETTTEEARHKLVRTTTTESLVQTTIESETTTQNQGQHRVALPLKNGRGDNAQVTPVTQVNRNPPMSSSSTFKSNHLLGIAPILVVFTKIF